MQSDNERGKSGKRNNCSRGSKSSWHQHRYIIGDATASYSMVPDINSNTRLGRRPEDLSSNSQQLMPFDNDDREELFPRIINSLEAKMSFPSSFAHFRKLEQLAHFVCISSARRDIGPTVSVKGQGQGQNGSWWRRWCDSNAATR